jgi:hypothetical protein
MNRIDRRDEIAGSDIERLFNCAIDARIPNDYFSLHRAVTLGQPVDGQRARQSDGEFAWPTGCPGGGGQDRKRASDFRIEGAKSAV